MSLKKQTNDFKIVNIINNGFLENEVLEDIDNYLRMNEITFLDYIKKKISNRTFLSLGEFFFIGLLFPKLLKINKIYGINNYESFINEDFFGKKFSYLYNDNIVKSIKGIKSYELNISKRYIIYFFLNKFIKHNFKKLSILQLKKVKPIIKEMTIDEIFIDVSSTLQKKTSMYFHLFFKSKTNHKRIFTYINSLGLINNKFKISNNLLKEIDYEIEDLFVLNRIYSITENIIIIDKNFLYKENLINSLWSNKQNYIYLIK